MAVAYKRLPSLRQPTLRAQCMIPRDMLVFASDLHLSRQLCPPRRSTSIDLSRVLGLGLTVPRPKAFAASAWYMIGDVFEMLKSRRWLDAAGCDQWGGFHSSTRTATVESSFTAIRDTHTAFFEGASVFFSSSGAAGGPFAGTIVVYYNDRQRRCDAPCSTRNRRPSKNAVCVSRIRKTITHRRRRVEEWKPPWSPPAVVATDADLSISNIIA